MFEDNDIFNPTRQVQRQGDWFEQRKQYRAQALVALRKREGLPSPVDADGVFLETRFDDQGNAHYYDARGNVVEHVFFAGAGKNQAVNRVLRGGAQIDFHQDVFARKRGVYPDMLHPQRGDVAPRVKNGDETE